MENNVLEELQRSFHDHNLIPFLGAGVSIPLGMISWKMLVEKLTEQFLDSKYKVLIDTYINSTDYAGAIDEIKKMQFVMILKFKNLYVIILENIPVQKDYKTII